MTSRKELEYNTEKPKDISMGYISGIKGAQQICTEWINDWNHYYRHSILNPSIKRKILKQTSSDLNIGPIWIFVVYWGKCLMANFKAISRHSVYVETTNSGKYWFVLTVRALKGTTYGFSGKIQWIYVKKKVALYSKCLKPIITW